MDLQELLGKEVDLVTEKMLHPYIRGRVLKESIPL
jgi:predicted nucleotidyltransferase